MATWRLSLLALSALAAAHGAGAQDLADLAARIDYGFHAEDARVIDAARAALERLPGDDSQVRYVRAFGALRAAQLARDARAAKQPLDECAALTAASDEHAESLILAAACAAVAVERGFPQERRRDQALARAAALDRDNPRVALVEAWTMQTQRGDAAATRAAAADKLTVAIERFRTAEPDQALVSWGEAEALARLAAIELERGEQRRARDLVERALLAAADYRYALELQRRLQRPPQ